MVSENGITNWLASSLDVNAGIIEDLKEVIFEDVMRYEENNYSVSFIYKEETIYVLISTFEKPEIKTVLVCERKNCKVEKPEDLSGILTTYDLKSLYNEIK